MTSLWGLCLWSWDAAYLRKKEDSAERRAEDVAQLLESLPGMHQVPRSIPSNMENRLRVGMPVRPALESGGRRIMNSKPDSNIERQKAA